MSTMNNNISNDTANKSNGNNNNNNPNNNNNITSTITSTTNTEPSNNTIPPAATSSTTTNTKQTISTSTTPPTPIPTTSTELTTTSSPTSRRSSTRRVLHHLRRRAAYPLSRSNRSKKSHTSTSSSSSSHRQLKLSHHHHPTYGATAITAAAAATMGSQSVTNHPNDDDDVNNDTFIGTTCTTASNVATTATPTQQQQQQQQQEHDEEVALSTTSSSSSFASEDEDRLVLVSFERTLRKTIISVGLFTSGAMWGSTQRTIYWALRLLELLVVAWMTVVLVGVALWRNRRRRGLYGEEGYLVLLRRLLPFGNELGEEVEVVEEDVRDDRGGLGGEGEIAVPTDNIKRTVPSPTSAHDANATTTSTSSSTATKSTPPTTPGPQTTIESPSSAPNPPPTSSPLYIINTPTLSRIIPNTTPVLLDNDYFYGQMMLMIRPSPDDPPSPSNQKYTDYFSDKQRQFEFQYQVKLKKIPTGQIWLGVELNTPIKLGMIQRAFVAAALSFLKRKSNGFHYSLEGREGNNGAQMPSASSLAMGRYEKPHLAFAVESGVDRLVATPPDRPLPILGRAIHENPESVKWRKKGQIQKSDFTGWNLEDTYTISLWSAYLDWNRWKCLNVPGIRPFSVCSIAGMQPMNLTLYFMDSAAKKTTKGEEDGGGGGEMKEGEDGVNGNNSGDAGSSPLSLVDGEDVPHYRCDMRTLAHLEFSHSLHSSGPYAKQWEEEQELLKQSVATTNTASTNDAAAAVTLNNDNTTAATTTTTTTSAAITATPPTNTNDNDDLDIDDDDIDDINADLSDDQAEYFDCHPTPTPKRRRRRRSSTNDIDLGEDSDYRSGGNIDTSGVSDDSDNDADSDALVEELGHGMYLRCGDALILHEVKQPQPPPPTTTTANTTFDKHFTNNNVHHLSNGGEFAILQNHHSPPYIIIEKAPHGYQNRSWSKTTRVARAQSRLIRSGDTVTIQLVDPANKNNDAATTASSSAAAAAAENKSTKYLSTHKGWWLKWVSTLPRNKAYFTIITPTSDADCQQLPKSTTTTLKNTKKPKRTTSTTAFEMQSTYLIHGGTFTLRHRRWKRYEVGVSLESSARFGGRMLGLHKFDNRVWAQAAAAAQEEREGQGQGQAAAALVVSEAVDVESELEYEAETTSSKAASAGKTGSSSAGKKQRWMTPLRLCAMIPTTTTTTVTASANTAHGVSSSSMIPPSPMVYNEEDNKGGITEAFPDVDPTAISTAIAKQPQPQPPCGSPWDHTPKEWDDMRWDVIAWVEIMHRAKRKRTRAYVVRCHGRMITTTTVVTMADETKDQCDAVDEEKQQRHQQLSEDASLLHTHNDITIYDDDDDDEEKMSPAAVGNETIDTTPPPPPTTTTPPPPSAKEEKYIQQSFMRLRTGMDLSPILQLRRQRRSSSTQDKTTTSVKAAATTIDVEEQEQQQLEMGEDNNNNGGDGGLERFSSSSITMEGTAAVGGGAFEQPDKNNPTTITLPDDSKKPYQQQGSSVNISEQFKTTTDGGSSTFVITNPILSTSNGTSTNNSSDNEYEDFIVENEDDNNNNNEQQVNNELATVGATTEKQQDEQQRPSESTTTMATTTQPIEDAAPPTTPKQKKQWRKPKASFSKKSWKKKGTNNILSAHHINDMSDYYQYDLDDYDDHVVAAAAAVGDVAGDLDNNNSTALMPPSIPMYERERSYESQPSQNNSTSDDNSEPETTRPSSSSTPIPPPPPPSQTLTIDNDNDADIVESSPTKQQQQQTPTSSTPINTPRQQQQHRRKNKKTWITTKPKAANLITATKTIMSTSSATGKQVLHQSKRAIVSTKSLIKKPGPPLGREPKLRRMNSYAGEEWATAADGSGGVVGHNATGNGAVSGVGGGNGGVGTTVTGGNGGRDDDIRNNVVLGSVAGILAARLSVSDQSMRMVSSVLSELVPTTTTTTTGGSGGTATMMEEEMALRQLMVGNDLDAWFLRGDAAQLGVVPVKGDEKIIYESLVARSLWESHWREEWCGVYERYISFYAPLTKKPAFSLSFGDIKLVRKLDMPPELNPLPGLSFLVLETTWRCHYLAFESDAKLEAFRSVVNTAIFNQDEQIDDDKETLKAKAGLWESFQASQASSLENRRGKWAPISYNSKKSKQRSILNDRRLIFDLQPFPPPIPSQQQQQQGAQRGMGLFIEDMTKQVLSFTTECLENNAKEFAQFLDKTSRLRALPIAMLDLSGKEAFCMFVNIYHCLLQHALLLTVEGPPNKRSVTQFMRTTCYEIGGDAFSLAELECCIIRGKMTPPVHLKPPFVDAPKESHTHRMYALGKNDPRINFVLNNASTSNLPAVPVLTPETLNTQLRVSTSTLLQRQIHIDAKKRTIYLPKICEIYRDDFGHGDPISCVLFCLQYLDVEMQELIMGLIDNTVDGNGGGGGVSGGGKNSSSSGSSGGVAIKYQNGSDFFYSSLRLLG